MRFRGALSFVTAVATLFVVSAGCTSSHDMPQGEAAVEEPPALEEAAVKEEGVDEESAVEAIREAAQVPEAGISIPSQRSGLWITAICGRGCENRTAPCDVYVLSEGEYGEYKEGTNQKKKLEPTGRTPLLLENLKAGVYYVGIYCVIDTSVVGMTQVGLSALRPRYEFFADDFPEETYSCFFTDDKLDPVEKGYRIHYALEKWYKVTLEDEDLYPVVGVFLQKLADPHEWDEYYPKGEAFGISLAPKQQRDFWDAMDNPGSNTHTISLSHRNTLANLLRRGGRVCLPLPEVGIVWVDEKGLLLGRRTAPSGTVMTYGSPVAAPKEAASR